VARSSTSLRCGVDDVTSHGASAGPATGARVMSVHGFPKLAGMAQADEACSS
jgi:hypothetical protein